MLVPVIDTWVCTKCEGCVEVCPSVFKVNNETGEIEVAELDRYPQDEVDEAIKCCPVDCISWADE